MTHGSRFLIQSKSRDIEGSPNLMASSFSLITYTRGTKGGGETLLKKLVSLVQKNNIRDGGSTGL